MSNLVALFRDPEIHYRKGLWVLLIALSNSFSRCCYQIQLTDSIWITLCDKAVHMTINMPLWDSEICLLHCIHVYKLIRYSTWLSYRIRGSYFERLGISYNTSMEPLAMKRLKFLVSLLVQMLIVIAAALFCMNMIRKASIGADKGGKLCG